MTTHFPGSAETWRDTPRVHGELPVGLTEASSGWPRQRYQGFRTRHALRRRRAEQIYALSRNPEQGLPVAADSAVISFIGGLIKQRKTIAIGLIVANACAGVAGLAVPRILGGVIDRAGAAGSTLAGDLDRIALMVVGIVVLQTLLTLLARRLSTVFGQDLLAAAREHMIRAVLRLPLSRVESASTGDLITRVTRDVGAMAGSVRWALPHFIISGIAAALTFLALVLNSPLLAAPSLVTVAVLFVAVRRYLRHAPKGYIAEGNAYSQISTSMTETVTGARTVESLGLQNRRLAFTDADIEVACQAEWYTISLRNELFLVTGIAYQIPMVLVVLLGGWGYTRGVVTLGQITAATIYLQQLSGPMERLIQTLNQMQMGMASTTRLLGIAAVPPDRTPTGAKPDGSTLVGSDLRFAYRPGHDVLHGIDLDLDLRPGERVAIVGPSGSGKSTLGRLLAGINAPRTGVVKVGGVDVMDLELADLRTQVALVTQEHHVFVGSIRDNIVLAREDTATDTEVWEALVTVEADDWVRRLPEGLDTLVGSGHYPLTPAQAQQIALARLVIADPHTLVLDEATSLIDPRTARTVEGAMGAMGALLADRTVVAIAHRLHTAHDADRIAVVIDGTIEELGSHDELMAMDGEYAALWRAWTS